MRCKAIPLAAKVEHLRKAAAYAERPQTVEAIETHMSWVFLTQRYAYKLKKPVRYDHLDFSTLAARRHDCTEELRLNRRLAETVYLDVVPLAVDEKGDLQLGGPGTIIDWLVKMRRLPAENMLDWALTHGTAVIDDACAVATRLSTFYMTLPAAAITPAAYRRRLRQGIDASGCELCDPVYAQPVAEVRALCAAQRDLLEQHRPLFDQRVDQGRIVEGHGDLRPEHVCLAPPLSIIDCLEFSEQHRILDIVDELGFLALECERLGAPEFGEMLLNTYSTITGDRPGAAIIHFYQSYRATVRAKIAARHLLEEAFRASPKWLDRTRQYRLLAERHIRLAEAALKHDGVSLPAAR